MAAFPCVLASSDNTDMANGELSGAKDTHGETFRSGVRRVLRQEAARAIFLTHAYSALRRQSSSPDRERLRQLGDHRGECRRVRDLPVRTHLQCRIRLKHVDI